MAGLDEPTWDPGYAGTYLQRNREKVAKYGNY